MREDRGGDGRSQRAVECPWFVRRDGTSVLFGGVWGLDGFVLCAQVASSALCPFLGVTPS